MYVHEVNDTEDIDFILCAVLESYLHFHTFSFRNNFIFISRIPITLENRRTMPSLPLKKRELREVSASQYSGSPRIVKQRQELYQKASSRASQTFEGIQRTAFEKQKFENFFQTTAQQGFFPWQMDPQEKNCTKFSKTSTQPTEIGAQKWLNRLTELIEFKIQYGHCYVPQRFACNKSLGKWVHKQRQLQKKKGGTLSEERRKILDRIGFWDEPPNKLELMWQKRFAELVAFKMISGNCNVPQRYSANAALGLWVHRQRSEFKRKLEGKKSSMNDQRVRALIAIGFSPPCSNHFVNNGANFAITSE